MGLAVSFFPLLSDSEKAGKFSSFAFFLLYASDDSYLYIGYFSAQYKNKQSIGRGRGGNADTPLKYMYVWVNESISIIIKNVL